ncbi:hypothetical protein ILUMI_14030, partial [Ignelater luminosus]
MFKLLLMLVLIMSKYNLHAHEDAEGSASGQRIYPGQFPYFVQLEIRTFRARLAES